MGVRALDLVGAGFGLIVLSPVLLAIGALVRLTSPGPALFRSSRVGRDGRNFVLLKFRSMVDNAGGAGPAITVADDARVTGVGRVLRRAKLDELPQLINVLRGDMSLVGPRPEDPAYVARYTRDQLDVLQARPGITSPASLRYRHEEGLLDGPDWEEQYLSQILPAKLAIDGEYLSRRTVWSDIRVILATASTLCRRQS